MAYQTGVAISPKDLLSKLNTFCVANGFTENGYGDDGVYQYLKLERNSKFFNLATKNDDTGDYIVGYISTAHDVSAHLGCTGGFTHNTHTNYIAGPYVAYHFFLDSQCVHIVIEQTQGLYAHFSFGEITKFGSWVGGEYIAGIWRTSTYSGPDWLGDDFNESYNRLMFSADLSSVNDNGGGAQVRADRTTTPQYYRFGYYQEAWEDRARGSSLGALWEPLRTDSPNTMNRRSTMLPIQLSGGAPDSLTYPLGFVPTMASIEIDNYTPGETINTDWVVFPFWQKFATSGTAGIAYKKVT